MRALRHLFVLVALAIAPSLALAQGQGGNVSPAPGATSSAPLPVFIPGGNQPIAVTIPNPSPVTPGAQEIHLGQVGGEAAVVTGTLTKSTKTTAYSSGQIVAQSATAGSCSPITLAVARANDKTGMVRRVRLMVNDTAWLTLTVRVHFFTNSPTFTNGDAANFAGGLSESSYIGYADVVIDQQFTSSNVKGIGAPAAGGEFNFVPSSGTQNIFAVLEARSTTGTVTASTTWTLTAEVLQN